MFTQNSVLRAGVDKPRTMSSLAFCASAAPAAMRTAAIDQTTTVIHLPRKAFTTPSPSVILGVDVSPTPTKKSFQLPSDGPMAPFRALSSSLPTSLRGPRRRRQGAGRPAGPPPQDKLQPVLEPVDEQRQDEKNAQDDLLGVRLHAGQVHAVAQGRNDQGTPHAAQRAAVEAAGSAADDG